MAIAALLRPKEPQVASDEWNIDTLRVHVENILAERKTQQEQRFEAQEKAVQAALSAQEKAIVKAEIATEKRFESVNEFRQQLADQTNTFLPKAEFNRAHDALVEKIAILYTFKDTTSGLIGKIDALTVQQEQSKGKSAGVNLVWVVAVGTTSLVINFAAIAAFLLKGPPSPSAVATDKRIDEVLSRLIAIQQQVDTNTARIITNTAKK